VQEKKCAGKINSVVVVEKQAKKKNCPKNARHDQTSRGEVNEGLEGLAKVVTPKKQPWKNHKVGGKGKGKRPT